jgi:TRAP-type C4-dicarboxylate transport system permease small subunit
MLIALRAGLDRAIQWLAIGLTVALLAVVVLGVITRALGDPLIWTDEISRFLMVWVAVAGWLLATRRRAHIRIRFFHNMLPKRTWRAAEIVIQCGILLLGILLAWYGVDIVVRNRDMEALSLPISLAWMYLPIVIAGLVTAAQAVGEIVEWLRDNGAPPAPIVDGAA